MTDNRCFFHRRFQEQYQDLVMALHRASTSNSLSGLSSLSLVTKRIRGREFTYGQVRRSDGKQQQIYIGLDNKCGSLKKKLSEDRKRESDYIEQLTKALRAVGMQFLPLTPWRQISALAEGGIFKKGGILLGDVAYGCIINLLGARLSKKSSNKLAYHLENDRIFVAMKRLESFPDNPLERLNNGISPFNEFKPITDGSISVTDHVEFLHSPWRKETITAENDLNKTSTFPDEKFLRYVIDSPVKAVALGRRPIPVNVPSPARYLIYLLIASQKSNGPDIEKCLQQAFELSEILKRKPPNLFITEKRSLCSWNREWVKLVEDGEKEMKNLYGDMMQ